MQLDFENLKKIMDSVDPEFLENVKENTTDLQRDVEIGDSIRFSSSFMEPFESERESTSKCLYSCQALTETSYSDMLEYVSEGVDEDDAGIKSLKMLIGIMGDNTPPLYSGFALNCDKDVTILRIMKYNDIIDTFNFNNVKSADDLIKLVSFHDVKYVDPLLVDFEHIKRIFED